MGDIFRIRFIKSLLSACVDVGPQFYSDSTMILFLHAALTCRIINALGFASGLIRST